MGALLKDGSLGSPEFLRFVRQLPCAFCGEDPPSDPHHYPGRGRLGATQDHRTCPVCRLCHRRCEQESVVINGVVRGPIAEIEQQIAVCRTLAEFIQHAPVADVVAFKEQLIAWRVARGEALPW